MAPVHAYPGGASAGREGEINARSPKLWTGNRFDALKEYVAGRLLPAALRRLGVLRLAPELAASVDLGEPLTAGAPRPKHAENLGF